MGVRVAESTRCVPGLQEETFAGGIEVRAGMPEAARGGVFILGTFTCEAAESSWASRALICLLKSSITAS